MAKMKVAEASGRVLAWMVAEAEGLKAIVYAKNVSVMFPGAPRYVPFLPHTDPAQSWPIIEREKISCHPAYISGTTESGAEVAVSNGWVCFHTPRLFWQKVRFRQAGPTLLIAAMRCYVTSKFGEEVEAPDELLEAA